MPAVILNDVPYLLLQVRPAIRLRLGTLCIFDGPRNFREVLELQRLSGDVQGTRVSSTKFFGVIGHAERTSLTGRVVWQERRQRILH